LNIKTNYETDASHRLVSGTESWVRSSKHRKEETDVSIFSSITPNYSIARFHSKFKATSIIDSIAYFHPAIA
jgi:hypothetical protein